MSNFDPTYTLDSVVTDVTGTNEVQKVTVKQAKGGTFTLTFNGDTTAAIAYNATAGTVADALAALNDLDADEFSVSGTLAEGLSITFEGAWGSQNVPALTADATALTDEGEDELAEVKIETTAAGSGSGVTRGTGLADRTGRVSPLAGESPDEVRENNAEDYGD